MILTDWFTIIGICVLGAVLPGPSLAVVLKHTLGGGRRRGSLAAVSHAIGIGFYALICISGLALIITNSPKLFINLQWIGAGYLLWLGIKGLISQPNKNLPEVSLNGAVRDGFLIVFLNPKVAIFFIALFSQLVGPDTSLPVRFVYVTTAMVIDGGWYLLVVWLFSNPAWLAILQQKSVWIERFFGLILVSFAGKLAINLL